MPNLKQSLVEIRGIGIATAKRITDVYIDREALVLALRDDVFRIEGISDEVVVRLKETFLPAPPPPPDPVNSILIRSIGQPVTINWKGADGKPKSLFVRPSFAPIPLDFIDILDSAHFNDLALMGRVEVKA